MDENRNDEPREPLGGSGETTAEEPDESYAGQAGRGGEERTGIAGGGGPASTTEPDDPKREEEAHRPDTEHGEL